MRKFLLSTTMLFVGLVSLNAQQLQSSKKVTSLKVQQVSAPVDPQAKIDPQLKSNAKVDTRPSLTSNIKKLGTVKSDAIKPATTKVPVEIKCVVTPALVQIITASGGEIVKTAPAENIITANVPVAALNKIATSTDVRYIAKASSAAPGLINSSKPFSANTKAPVATQPAVDQATSTFIKNKTKGLAN